MQDHDTTTETQETLWVQRTYSERGIPTWTTQSDPEKLEVRRFLTSPAYVRVGQSATINLGNYESVKIDCGISLPCYAEESEAAFKRAWDAVETEMGKQINAVREEQQSMNRAPKGKGK